MSAPTPTTPAAALTYEEAHEIVCQAEEIEAECRAEYGSGCVSLGYDPGEWGAAYDGFRAASVPEYVEAKRLLRDRYEVVRVVIRRSAAYRALVADSIPF